MIFSVFNMAKDETELYLENDIIDSPVKALIVSYFQSTGLRNTGDYQRLFEEYADRVVYGQVSASIGDFAVRVKPNEKHYTACHMSDGARMH